MAIDNKLRSELSHILQEWDHEHGRHSHRHIDYEIGSQKSFLTEKNRRDLKKYLDEQAEDKTTFSGMVLQRIDQLGKRDSEISKAAGISRSVFSNLRKDNDYQPSRETALALTIVLEMSLEESERLMEKAGFALSDDRRFDQIIRFCIMNKLYDIMDVNELLYESGEQTIVVKGDKKNK